MNSNLFDAYYYAHDCGRPYQRDEVWLAFFDHIAQRIIEQSEPKTALDAGCAWGFLVEAFRKRGVEAYGVDISEYAIQNVHPEIQQYCRVGSITDPFPQEYDVITCIEVLEHMPQAEAEKAIENLCVSTEEIIFSSTPFDFKEVTHLNVRPPEYWSEQFARQGFYRDLEADLSHITAWAARFVRIKRTNIKLVQDYERKFWQFKKENYDLRQLSGEVQGRVKQLETQLEEKERTIQSLSQQVLEKEQSLQSLSTQIDEKDLSLNALSSRLKEIEISKAWKLAVFFRWARMKLLPPRSRE
jgi:SAM-dependent methyltransferase